jgi:hypothetical protein
MKTRTIRGDRSDRLPLVVSEDGYVRLTMAAFRAIRLNHLLSELDADINPPPSTASGACLASIVGYTEWASQAPRGTVTGLGLAHCDLRLPGALRARRRGPQQRHAGRCAAARPGALATGVLLCDAVDALGWEQAVDDYISNRYACNLSNLTVTESRTSL